MPFIKIIKTKSYYKRFQVKFRRRREGKTDYYARRRLICQDKNKYNSPKYRLVVRFSNTDITCQVVYATLEGDWVLASAYAKELKHYGVVHGFTNYAAAYATGLLVARRALKALNLDEQYVGIEEEKVGEMYEVEEGDGPSPFFVLLDVGLSRTTTGARLFACLKGAVDGGLAIPHEAKRFVGFDKETKELKPEVLRKYIYGGHVSEYMALLKEKDEEVYRTQFSKYIEKEITSDNLQDMWKNCHKTIRDNPEKVKKEKRKEGHYHVKYLPVKKNSKQRKNTVHQKLQNLEKKAAEAEAKENTQ